MRQTYEPGNRDSVDNFFLNKCYWAAQRYLGKIVKGGVSVLLWQAYSLFLLIFAVPTVVVMRLLRPLVIVRFGAICAKRIGHFAASPEVYLCERDVGLHSRRTFDIFYHIKPVSNQQLKKMWDRMLYVCQLSRFASLVWRINHFLPDAKIHAVPISLESDRDIHGFFRTTPPHLFFTQKEETRGREALSTFGVREDDSFVCFHARNSVYLNTAYPSYNWDYHNYRDSNIKNYIYCAEELARRGYYAIRMGAAEKQALPVSNPRIIDYAAKHRSDFMDIYLSAKCKFFISANSGISMVSTIFRRPVVFVNFIPLEYAFAWSPIHLFIPKKLWSRKEKRFLAFREILGLGIGKLPLRIVGQKYQEYGIDIVENTPEEIAAVALEMDRRLNGEWRETEETEELQSFFWRLFNSDGAPITNTVRIGTDFLLNNRDLLV